MAGSRTDAPSIGDVPSYCCGVAFFSPHGLERLAVQDVYWSVFDIEVCHWWERLP